MITRSSQYLIKWIASFRMAENVIARGNLKNKHGVSIGLRRGGRGKGKRRGNGEVVAPAQAGKTHTNFSVYTARQATWLSTRGGRT